MNHGLNWSFSQIKMLLTFYVWKIFTSGGTFTILDICRYVTFSQFLLGRSFSIDKISKVNFSLTALALLSEAKSKLLCTKG